MSMYELTFLLNDEAELETLKKYVAGANGKITEEKNLGKKDLTYEIKKQKSANYYTWKVEMDEKDVADFKKKLNYNDKLLRYLFLKP